jgi:hypothetical protein
MTDISPNAITAQCACASREFNGKRLFVVDTPGFLDPNVESEDIQTEVAKSYQMTALPGPHAFLLVLEPGKFLPQEAEAIDYLTKIFNSQAIDHTIIIFTHGDALTRAGKTIKSYLELLKPDHFLKKLIEQCKNRYLSVDNIGTDAEKQTAVEALLTKIAEMVTKNGGQVYRSAIFDAVAEVIDVEKSKGTYYPYKPDGSYALLSNKKC